MSAAAFKDQGNAFLQAKQFDEAKRLFGATSKDF
jgi:hypothetical protein